MCRSRAAACSRPSLPDHRRQRRSAGPAAAGTRCARPPRSAHCRPGRSPARCRRAPNSAGACNRCAPIRAMRSASSRHAVPTAPPAITMQREPQVPVEYGVSAVSPCTTRIDRERNAQHFVRHLRQRGLQSLAMALDADAQFQPAVGSHARDRLLEARHHRNAPAGIDRRAVRRLLAEDAAAEADAQRTGRLRLSARARRADRSRDDAAQTFRIIAAVEVFAW